MAAPQWNAIPEQNVRRTETKTLNLSSFLTNTGTSQTAIQVSYSIQGSSPMWISLGMDTLTFSPLIDTALGSVVISVRATNSDGDHADNTVSVNVQDVPSSDTAPVWRNIPTQNVKRGETGSINLTQFISDSGTSQTFVELSYSIQGSSPSWITLPGPTMRVLTFSPTASTALGPVAISLRAVNDANLHADTTVSINVQEADAPDPDPPDTGTSTPSIAQPSTRFSISNDRQYISGRSSLTPVGTTMIEGPPNVDISMTPKDLGNPCGRIVKVIFTWSEPTEFLNNLILRHVGNTRNIALGNALISPVSPSNTIYVFTQDVESISGSSYVDQYQKENINSAKKGDVARSINGNWVYQGNITDIPTVAELDQISGTPNTISFVDGGSDLPSSSGSTSINSNDIIIFTVSKDNLSNFEDNHGNEITSTEKGTIAQFGGSKWIRRGYLARQPFLIDNGVLYDENRIELISGTIESDNNLIWKFEARINDAELKGSFDVTVLPDTGYGLLSNTTGPKREGEEDDLNNIAIDTTQPFAGRIVQNNGTEWIGKGDVRDLNGIAQINRISIGVMLPPSPEENDVFIFITNALNGEVRYYQSGSWSDIGNLTDLDSISSVAAIYSFDQVRSVIDKHRHATLNFDFSECDYPEVEILIDEDTNGGYHQNKYEVLFRWNQNVSGFGSKDDIEATDNLGDKIAGVVFDDNLSPVDGSYNLYRSTLNFPPMSKGTAFITVKANSASGVNNIGPAGDTSISIDYDTNFPTTCTIRDAAFEDMNEGSRAITHSTDMIDLRDNKYLNNALEYSGKELGNPAGGLFNGVFESKMIGDYHFMLVQIMKQSYGYLRLREQAGAAIIVCNRTEDLTNIDNWRLVKAYSDITIAARSFTELNSHLYFFEGSHYAYLPQASFTNNDLSAPTRIDISSMVNVDAIVRSSLPNGFGNANEAIIFSLYDIKPTYDDIQKSATLMNTKINDVLKENFTSLDIRVNITQKIADFMDPNQEGGEPSIGLLIQHVKNLLRAFSINRDSDEWKEKIGTLRRVQHDSTTVEDRGNVWRSATTEDNPDHDDENPDYFYGVHGGMSSPIFINDDIGEGELNMVTGYGNLREGLIRNASVDQINLPMNDIGNWCWVKYSNKINHKMSLLETNERSPYEIMVDIAKVTNSIFGVESDLDDVTGNITDKFFMRPRDPRKAKLLEGSYILENSESVFIHLKRNSQNWIGKNYPTSGLILINDELISYKPDPGNNALGSFYLPQSGTITIHGIIERGVHGTTPARHEAESEVLWVDHFISMDMQAVAKPIQSLGSTNQSEHLYNEISVSYGDGEPYKDENKESIVKNRRKKLSIDTILDNHQKEWAKWIAESYKERFSEIHNIIDLELKTTLYMKLGEVVVINQQDRAKLKFTPCQILEISQNPSSRTTSLKLVTL